MNTKTPEYMLGSFKDEMYASTHTHVKSQFDADMDPKKLVKKLKELGSKGFILTDHGVLSAVEDYKAACDSNGLKFVPGCELYVDGGILGRLHLVVFAKDDLGYKGIGKLVTLSNKNLHNGFPVATFDMLKNIMSQYKGHIIATSACVQGVVAAVLLQNQKVKEKTAKIIDKRNALVENGKAISPLDTRIEKANAKVKSATAKLNDALAQRDECKRTAEQKFGKREKALLKLQKETSEEARLQYQILVNELEADKKASEVAQKELPALKEAVEVAKKALSAAKKEQKALNEKVASYNGFNAEIEDVKKNLKSMDELYAAATNEARKYADMFGEGNFFMELQYHGIPIEEECMPVVAEIAKELKLPVIAANDVHILENTKEERLKRQILRSLRYGENFEEENVGDDQLYFKTDRELAQSLLEILPYETVWEAIENIKVAFDACNVEFKRESHYPVFPSQNGKTADEMLDEAIAEGIKRKFPNGLDEAHQKRLDYELPIIKSMGYSDYHLIVKDFLEYGRLLGYVPEDRLDEAPLTIPELKEWIKKNDWKNGGCVIGPGRGSAVGSFACYVLDIVKLDPLKYDLLFERFLNPERISMPDIDSDISNTTREYVIKYVTHKYGENAVCGIMTTNSQAPKGAIRIAGRFYGKKKYGEELTSLAGTIAKRVPNEVGISFSSKITEDGVTLKDSLLEEFSGNKDAVEIINWASIIEGSFTAYGAHAAGIVISDNDDVSDYIPLRWSSNKKQWTTQCNMAQVEENGLLKFDFLGLKTLDIITNAIRLIEQNHGIIIDPLKIDLNDQRVLKNIFAAGKTNSVFQFESSGMKSMLKQFGPTSFEDLIILISMFRPGPMQYLDDVIAVKNGKKPKTYLCKELEPILEKTYAAIVYQEQVMQICQDLAGYTLGQADMVRRYMSKKKEEPLKKERAAFVYGDEKRGIIGCVKNGISAEVANTLFDQMMDFAKYAFNKSHAAAYAFNSFITGWLKEYYPAEFFAAAMNWATNEKLPGLMYEAKNFGVKVSAPDINISEEGFSISNNTIIFGLSAVASVKDNAREIIEERKAHGAYESVKDFLLRTTANKRVVANLAGAGAFDSIYDNRAAIKISVEDLIAVRKKINEKEQLIEAINDYLPIIESFKTDEELVKHQEEAGKKVEFKKLCTVAALEKKLENANTSLSILNDDYMRFIIPNVKEDKAERLKEEREFLGLYVTEHPMDYYPKAAEVGALPIAETEVGEDICIYGVISDLNIKYRKSDKRPMAFFNLEDQSGTMEVCCFTKKYEQYANQITENTVVKINGKCEESESYITDEDGNPITELKFYVESIVPVAQEKTTYMLSVSSYAAFHLDNEKMFKKMFAEEGGHPFIVHDQALDEMREMTYRISESALEMPMVFEV